MNSKIIEQPKEVKPEYPCLKIHNFEVGKTIALFTEPGKGTVVLSENSVRKLGQFYENLNEGFFTPFTGKIELSN